MSNPVVRIQVEKNTPKVSLRAGTGGKIFPVYTGETDVIPKINEVQILETKDKRMTEDVTVHEISVSSVSNPYGGQTVTIGIV